MQAIIKRISSKENVSKANLALVKQVDAKQKSMEIQMAQLLRMSKEVADHHNKLLQLRTTTDQLSSKIDESNQQVEF